MFFSKRFKKDETSDKKPKKGEEDVEFVDQEMGEDPELAEEITTDDSMDQEGFEQDQDLDSESFEEDQDMDDSLPQEDESLDEEEAYEDEEMDSDQDSDGMEEDFQADDYQEDAQAHEIDGDVIYIAGDGDGIGKYVGQAMLHDDEQALHEISQAINDGQEMIIGWAEQNGGTVISAGGDEFIAIIPSHLADQLEDVRLAYSEIVGTTLTLGVGGSMSDAGKALIMGKLQGKDQLVEFSPEMDDQLVGDEQVEESVDTGLEEPMDQEIEEPLEQIEESQVNELKDPIDLHKDETSLRDRMLQVVEGFKAEQQTIEATQEQNPELYQSFMTTLAAMIDLARKLEPQEEAPAEEIEPSMQEPIQEDPSMEEEQPGEFQG